MRYHKPFCVADAGLGIVKFKQVFGDARCTFGRRFRDILYCELGSGIYLFLTLALHGRT